MTRILLADDDSGITTSLVAFLKSEHEVDVVNNGASAYNKLASGGFGLAILDWDMPEMTGKEICRKFRAAGGQTPIIMLTGRVAEDDKEAGFDAGADDYLTKPFSYKELAGRIKSLLRRSATTMTSATNATISAGRRRLRVCLTCSKQYSADDPGNEFCTREGSPTVPVSAEELIGLTVCGGYKIESLLGAGAWSEVYKAIHQETGQTVAIKILHVHLASDPIKAARFCREAEALLKVQHRCLARVYEQSQLADGRPCLIMEFLDGMSLETFLTDYTRMTLAQAKHFYILMSEGLAVAHAQGLIHRDLKPGNVYIVNESGMVIPKILDFGMAKILNPEGESALASLTQTGEVLGTPAYMSPEQCMGSPIDSRSDLYALGLLIYESLTGERCMAGKNAFEAMSNQLVHHPAPINEVCPSAQISPAIEALIFKLLEKRPEDRFSNAKEFAERFQAAH